jgi:hypothetical protein
MAPAGGTDWIGIWTWSLGVTMLLLWQELFTKKLRDGAGQKNRIPPLPKMQGWGRSA